MTNIALLPAKSLSETAVPSVSDGVASDPVAAADQLVAEILGA